MTLISPHFIKRVSLHTLLFFKYWWVCIRNQSAPISKLSVFSFTSEVNMFYAKALKLNLNYSVYLGIAFQA